MLFSATPRGRRFIIMFSMLLGMPPSTSTVAPAKIAADSFDPKSPATISRSVLRGAGGADQNASANAYLAVAANAAPHFRAFGPLGGAPCGTLELTSRTAKANGCRWAVNGGPFNMSSGACDDGVFILNGEVVGSGGWRPVFGATHDGSWVLGTLNQSVAERWRVAWAVNGFSWLVKDGAMQVPSTPRSLLHAPRTAIGVDARGRLMMLEVDGCEPYKGCGLKLGLTLRGTAELLLAHGAWHAINLDGGGSSVTVENGTVISHPTDSDDWLPRRERMVANIACVV